jgi:hypothetical protein
MIAMCLVLMVCHKKSFKEEPFKNGLNGSFCQINNPKAEGF